MFKSFITKQPEWDLIRGNATKNNYWSNILEELAIETTANNNTIMDKAYDDGKVYSPLCEKLYTRGTLTNNGITYRSWDLDQNNFEYIKTYLFIYNTFYNGNIDSNQIRKYVFNNGEAFQYNIRAIRSNELTYFNTNDLPSMKEFFKKLQIPLNDLKLFVLMYSTKYNTPASYDGTNGVRDEVIPKSWLENNTCTISSIEIITE
jgi:hypothetical protein